MKIFNFRFSFLLFRKMEGLQMPTTKQQFFYYVEQLEPVQEEWQTRRLQTLLNCFKLLFRQAELFQFSSKFINFDLRLLFKHLLPYSIQVEVTPFELKTNKEMEYFLRKLEHAILKRVTCERESRMRNSLRHSYRSSEQSSAPRCVFCNYTDHPNYGCPMGYRQRVSVIRMKRLCFSCLRPGHQSRDCMMDIQCRHCGADHYNYMCVWNDRVPRFTRPDAWAGSQSPKPEEERH